MKINGKNVTQKRIVDLCLPTAEGAVQFKFRALGPDEDFEKVVPKPKAPRVKSPGKPDFFNYEDPGFKARHEQWIEQKISWEFLKSISETDGLEWATVDMADPSTWKNYQEDLAAVFNTAECLAIWNAFHDAQYITEETMQKARADFLTGTLDRLGASYSQMVEQSSTPSGEPANDSE